MNCEDLKKYQYAVIGDPISHSKSPQMQNAAFEFHDLGRPYGKIQVKTDELADFVAYARENMRGFNVTVPHKQSIIQFIDNFTEIGKLCNSINTVRIENGNLYGTSTDGEGLAKAVEGHFGMKAENLKITFAGAGGAAQSGVWFFVYKGAKKINICNRTLEKAQQMSDALKKAFPALETEVCLMSDFEKMQSFIADSDLFIQATSVGLKDDDPPPFDPAVLDANKNICVYDLIYKETKILKYCREKNIRCADGSNMLLGQGAAAFKFWTKLEAPENIMKQALEELK